MCIRCEGVPGGWVSVIDVSMVGGYQMVSVVGVYVRFDVYLGLYILIRQTGF